MAIRSLRNAVCSSVFFLGLIKIAGLFKINCIFGSQMAFFSATNVCMPLSGAFGGIAGGLGIFGARLFMRLLFSQLCPLACLVHYLPGLAASLYWSSTRVIIRLALPLLCMILFIMHPVGMHAIPYACYWLIPIGLYFVRRKTVFLEALGSTFVAHAVGSVIWLYTVPMTAQMWWALIPVVAVERLLFACSMVVMYYTLHYCMRGMYYCAYLWRSTLQYHFK